MRRPALLIAAATCALLVGAAPAALAAPPEHSVEAGDPTTDPDLVDPDFCGTGETVETSFVVRSTVFEESDLRLVVNAHGTQTLTAVSTGQSVTLHFAQRLVSNGVENPDGTVTFTDTYSGLPEQFRLPNGGVITLDAGRITFDVTVEGEDVLSRVIVSVSGPHPSAESDFQRFCELIPAALGIG